jgi:bifunctional enzyme CysN/CysC
MYRKSKATAIDSATSQNAISANHLPKTIEEFLAQQLNQDLVRFITCGSVDDGKSTLIGRLLWESQQLFDDQLAALKSDSKRYGTQGDDIDFALLVDGLSAEREQGITIDVAYRFFATHRRKFIVADTPGHEQYTRNMVTGASTAEVAIILVDAKQGILTQTKRHAYLTSLMGIKHAVLAINKMDTVAYKQDIYQKIKDDFEVYCRTLNFDSVTTIPVCALKGDNITTRSPATPWYNGPSLISFLETIRITPQTESGLIFPVQWVNRPDSSFRGFSGTVARGSVQIGDHIRVTASGQSAYVKAIIGADQITNPLSTQSTQESAQKNSCAYLNGEAITLQLDKEIDISRGDVLTMANQLIDYASQFEAKLIWMNANPGLAGRKYDLKLSTQWTGATISNVRYRVNINTGAHEPSATVSRNEIVACNIFTDKPIALTTYTTSKELGGFILVDRQTNATTAVGLIRHTLRRSINIHKQALSVTRQIRENLNGHPSKVVWLTGLSGSGKSTIANALEIELASQGKHTYILDGDNVRLGLNKDLGFTDADRIENIRRMAEVAKLMMDAGLIVITAFISPFKEDRARAREIIGTDSFIEVFVDTPLEICEQRDTKGLYKNARAGLLPNMTGIGSRYEAPDEPELRIGSGTTVAEAARRIAKLLNE